MDFFSHDFSGCYCEYVYMSFFFHFPPPHFPLIIILSNNLKFYTSVLFVFIHRDVYLGQNQQEGSVLPTLSNLTKIRVLRRIISAMQHLLQLQHLLLHFQLPTLLIICHTYSVLLS